MKITPPVFAAHFHLDQMRQQSVILINNEAGAAATEKRLKGLRE